jgi:hypothetical protein
MPQQPLPQQKKIKKAPNNFAVSKKHRTFARDLKIACDCWATPQQKTVFCIRLAPKLHPLS